MYVRAGRPAFARPYVGVHRSTSLIELVPSSPAVSLQLHKNATSNFEQVLEATPHKAPTVQPPTSHHENYQS